MASTLRDSAPQVTRHLQRAFAPSQEVLGSFIGGNGPSCYLQLFCLKQCILSNAPIQLDWQIWMFNAFCTKFSLSLSEFRGIYHTQKPWETNAVRWAISQLDDTVAQWVVRIAWGQRLLPAFHMDGPGHCLPLIRTWPVDLRGQCTFWWQGAK